MTGLAIAVLNAALNSQPEGMRIDRVPDSELSGELVNGSNTVIGASVPMAVIDGILVRDISLDCP
jgi:hypothetical protein